MKSSVRVFRLCASKYASSLSEVFGGAGAARTGGRWNTSGHLMGYTSESRALALLEVLVHLDTLPKRDYVMASLELPLELIAQPALEDLPPDWQRLGENPLLKSYGDGFLRDGRYLALRVPSVVLPAEFNYLLNPLHSSFATLEGDMEPFGFDSRLRPQG